MEYSEGTIGRSFVAKFDHEEDFLEGLRQLAKEKDIRAGMVFFVGALKEARIVAGPCEPKIPPVPHWLSFNDAREVLGLGTIFWDDEGPQLHLHAGFGKGNTALVGCIREKADVFLITEVVILELQGVTVSRKHDETSKLSLMHLG